MRSHCSDLSDKIPIRARVAFVLALAERVLPSLANNPAGFQAAQQALADAWRWEEGEDVRAAQLYENDVSALAVQGSLITNTEESAAMCAATSAFYYVLWHAFRQDINNGQVSEGE